MLKKQMNVMIEQVQKKTKEAFIYGGDIIDLDSNSLTLAKQFDKNLERNGDEGVYYYTLEGNTIFNSYREIKDHALKSLNGLYENKIVPKDMIIFQCENSKDYIDTFWACMYGGMVPVLANLPKDLKELSATDSVSVKNIWDMLGAPKIVVSNEIFDQYVNFAEKIGIDVNCLINIDSLHNYEATINIYDAQPDDLAMMFFTSGSTGMPKGVLQTQEAAVMREYGVNQLNQDQKDVILNWMPLEHAGGVLMSHFRGIVLGSKQIQVEPEYILSNPLRWLDLMEKHRVNYSWAPHFAYVLINELIETVGGEWDLSYVDILLNGGEMVHAQSGKEFLKNMQKYGLKPNVMRPVWGMCETCSGVIYNLDFNEQQLSGVQLVSKDLNQGVLSDSEKDANTITEIGVPVPGCSVKITNRKNEILPEDTIGRLLIKGPSVTQGYYKNEEVNKESFTEDGWFITGDLGFIHDGKITLTGRDKDIIIVNGLNYNNVEVEAVIEENDKIEKSFTAVCAVTDPSSQMEKVIAFIVPRNGQQPESIIHEIKKHVLEKINLRIDQIIPVRTEDIPKSNLGKIQRSKIGKQYLNGDFSDIDSQSKDRLIGLEKVEDSITDQFGIKEVALIMNKDTSKLPSFPVSDLTLALPNQERSVSQAEIKEEVTEKIISELINIEEAKVQICWEKNEKNRHFHPIIFFETGLKDFHFNLLVLKKIQDKVINDLGYPRCILIPVSCLEISNLEDTEISNLISAYNQGDFHSLLEKVDSELLNPNRLPQWFYKEKLVPRKEIKEVTLLDNRMTLIVSNDAEVIQKIKDTYPDKLEQFVFLVDETCKQDCDLEGLSIEWVNIYEKKSYESAIQKWFQDQDQLDVIHLAGCETSTVDSIDQLRDAQYKTVISLQNIIQIFGKMKSTLNRILVVTENALAIGNHNNHNYAVSTVSGFVKAAFDEGHLIKHIDIDSASKNSLLDMIQKELGTEDSLNQVIYRNQQRNQIFLDKVDIRESSNKEIPLVTNGFYLITGGLGGIGKVVAELLLERFQAHVLLVGRTQLEEHEDHEKYKVYKELQSLEEYGGSVSYEQCNITDEQTVLQLISEYEEKLGQSVNGIIHLAGGIAEQLVENQVEQEIMYVYEAKLFGTYVLAKVMERYQNAIYITTSSARTLLPGMTVSAYCSGSEFNAHISGFMRENTNIQSYCLSWSQWDEIGMGKGLVVKNVLDQKGLKKISVQQGKNSFMMALKCGSPYMYVGLDSTKKEIGKLVLNRPEPQEEIQVFTNFKHVLNKEEEFKSFVENTINEINELIGMEIDFRFVFNLPLDKNGFVDKTLLSDRKNIVLGDSNIVKPRSDVENKVYQAWKKIFKHIDFGVTDNFFDLGGDSIKIIQLISILKSEFRVDVKNQDIFKLITIEQQAAFFEKKLTSLDEIKEIATNDEDVEIVEAGAGVGENAVILSAAQKRQWVLYEINPESPYYNNTVAINVSGTIVIPCLKMSLYQLVERHESLRTKYGEIDGQFYQFIEESVDLAIDEINLMDLTEEEKTERLEQIYTEEANKVIHIDQDIPIRATIIQKGVNEVILLISIHHIASDGWSMRVLLQDLSAIYSDILTFGRSKLEALPMQYSDYAKWQYRFMKSPEYSNQLAYWKEELKGAPPALELPIDKEKTDEIENVGKRLIFEIDQEVTSKLKTICKENNCTLYMLLMSAFSTLMHRYSNQEDIVLGTLIANRNQAELEKMIGFFVNTLPIRLNVEADMPFTTLLEQVKDKTLQMYDHQDVPFDALIDELGVERESGKNPLFQTLFVVQNAQLENMKDSFAEWDLTIMDSDTSKFDFIAQVFEIGNKLSVKFEYDTNLFLDETIQRWSEHFKLLVELIIRDQTQEVGSYDILTQEERNTIQALNETATDYAVDKNIYELFEETVARVPQQTAVSTKDQKVTYEQLKEKVDRLVVHLSDRGVRHKDHVAIVADKSLDTIVGILALLKVGAAYVPVNRNYPKEFLEYILNDSQAQYILCNKSNEDMDSLNKVEKVVIDGEWDIQEKDSHEVVGPHDKAYIMYTSGSTGKPKGVMVTHRNIIRLVNQTNFIEILEDDVILQTGSITFDASTFEIWGALLNGIELRLVEEDVLLDSEALRKEIEQSKVTIMWVSAPLFNQLVEEYGSIFNGVRTLLVGGDVVQPKYTNKVRSLCSGIEIINGYGPTENTTFSTTFKIDRDYDTSIPIGKPIANSTAYIVNKKMQIQPIGVIGELVVGGDGVAIGYLNKSELTQQNFVANSFDKSDKLYKTGDFAKLNREGNIEYIGRIDKQIKIRGFRIELQAIEQAISSIEEVDQVIVSCIEEDNNKKIVAYYTGDVELDILTILEQKLPKYMLPHHIIHLDEIPLNKNGKVDHSRLPKRFDEVASELKQTYLAPETEDEKILFDIWSKLLKTSEFGVNDNFFKLGGDSIMVIQLTNVIKKEGYLVTTKMVFKHQTIRNLAAQLTKAEAPMIEEKEVKGEGILGPIQQWFFDQKMKNQHFWNLPLMIHLEEKHDTEVIKQALDEVISYHDSLNTTFIETETGVVQYYGGKKAIIPFEVVDVTNAVDAEKVMKQKAESSQQKINIHHGPLVSAVLFNGENEQHLFIGIHHLVVDGISLRIIGEDIMQVIEQIEKNEKISLQPKTVSFKQWTEKLKEYGNSEQALSEIRYWKEINDQSSHFIYLEEVNQENTSQTNNGILDRDTTQMLTKKSGLNLGAEINDLLIAALYKTFAELFDIDRLSLKLEGHGREDILKDMDISRTVGWFTTAYPILIKSSKNKALENIVIDVKETLRNVPNKGIGYGILKYLTDQKDMKLDFEPEISFNYLGVFDDEMEVGSREYGIFHDESATRDVAVDFNIVLFKGEMNVYLTLHNSLIEKSGFDRLLERYLENIKLIAQHGTNLQQRIYSASDFPLVKLNTEEVQSIVEEYKGKVKDIYPLSVGQKGMLYHYLMNPKSEDYFGQIHCHLYGELNKELFNEAWNHVMEINPILSTVYKWEDVEEPVQIVLENEGFNIRYENAKEQSRSDEELLQKLLAEDKENLFDLNSLPIIRVMVVELEEHTEFVFSFHHISLDGWSVFVMMSEVIETYKKITMGQEIVIAPDKGKYKDYIQWLQDQDMEEVKAFWSDYFKGFEEKNGIWGILEEEDDTIIETDFKQQTIALSHEEERKLNQCAKELGVTVSTLLQSALAITLHHFSGSHDIVFGVTVSGRNSEVDHVNSISGLLINTIPLRIQLDATQDIQDYIHSVQQNAFEVNNYSMLSMADIKGVSDIDNAEEIFDVLFVFENYPVDQKVSDRNGELSFGTFESHERTNYALTIVAVPEETLKIRLSYLEHMVNNHVMDAFMTSLKSVLMNVCSHNGTVLEVKAYDEEFEQKALDVWSQKAVFDTLYEDQEEIYSVMTDPEVDASVYILDENLKPSPLGIPGEVYIGIKDINLIKSDWVEWMIENKIHNEVSSDKYQYLYKTGDIAMWISEGKISILEH